MITLFLSSCSDPKPKRPVEKSDTVDVRLNVYFESSMSMDGYVRGDNEFESAMMKLMGSLDRVLQPNTLRSGREMQGNTYQLRQATLFTAECAAKDSLVAISQVSEPRIDQISKWFQRVEPTNLGSSKGRMSSELATVLKLAFSNVQRGSVNVLISDMILSPTISAEGISATADDYQTLMQRILLKEQAGIENALTPLIAESKIPISMLGCRFESRYYGLFTPEIIRCTPVKLRANKRTNRMELMRRPFYVWIVGDAEVIKHISSNLSFDDLKIDGLTDVCHITDSRRKGRSLKSEVKMPRQVKFPPALVTQSSYAVDDNGRISVSRLGKANDICYAVDVTVPINVRYAAIEATAKAINAGHADSVVAVSALPNGKQRLFIRSRFANVDATSNSGTLGMLTCRKPMWFNQYSTDDDDRTIEDEGIQRTTFGLRYLMDGVWKSFHPADAVIGSFEVAYN
ncbi:MAG: hypothetical protein FGM32_09085 [Candidatus Kapabacteria bacterium]|nr:hypothetical protein [Candidatus Kapabacteria bacterium]